MPGARALVVFARAPELGRVKTRLAARIGEEAALAAYRLLGSVVTRGVAAVRDCRRVVAYTPAGDPGALRAWLGDDFEYVPQCDGDLGARMAEAITLALGAGAERVVVIGTDCPDVDVAVVERAFRALDGADVVLGPADDGGYYLIAMARVHRALFEAIPWSAPDTLRVTLDRAAERGLTVALLETKRDVDTVADLRAWRASRSA